MHLIEEAKPERITFLKKERTHFKIMLILRDYRQLPVASYHSRFITPVT